MVTHKVCFAEKKTLHRLHLMLSGADPSFAGITRWSKQRTTSQCVVVQGLLDPVKTCLFWPKHEGNCNQPVPSWNVPVCSCGCILFEQVDVRSNVSSRVVGPSLMSPQPDENPHTGCRPSQIGGRVFHHRGARQSQGPAVSTKGRVGAEKGRHSPKNATGASRAQSPILEKQTLMTSLHWPS